MANPPNPNAKPKSSSYGKSQQETPTYETEEETPSYESEEPGGDGPECPYPDDGLTPITYTDPQEKCEPRCNCPTVPPANETCLDKLITEKTQEADRAKRAEEFKKELEDVRKKATAAKLAYSHDKYEDFKKRWTKLDREIVCAIEHVTCKVSCWWCLIECEICPLLYRIRQIERALEGDNTLIAEAHSLYDVKFWHERNLEAKTRRFNRIKEVLEAWYDPAKSIEAALVANDKLVKSVTTMAGEEAVLQLFFKLIPLHLAIAPRPLGDNTQIDEKYRQLCATDCDKGDPDDCCGPDVGVLRASERMIEKPQAYIIDPDEYFKILCCLARDRYIEAERRMTEAAAGLLAAQADIDNHIAELARRKKSVADDFKRRIVTPIDCEKYPPSNGGGDGGYGSQNPPDTDLHVR